MFYLAEPMRVLRPGFLLELRLMEGSDRIRSDPLSDFLAWADM
jgi:hypothetical protein